MHVIYRKEQFSRFLSFSLQKGHAVTQLQLAEVLGRQTEKIPPQNYTSLAGLSVGSQ